MTDVERRRLKLLQDVRKTYSERNTPPAVHPRYQSTYLSLYASEEERMHAKGTFTMRLIISILIFGLFCIINYQNESYGAIDSQYIVQEIQREQFDFDLFR
ncbi:MAG: hypothetical protein IJZ53_10135 [Tyzzerella sp.]|nr:hypothetical protein [Tyzzerella sp.]